MKNKAEILDCTLRDGSYVLNYNFNKFETSLIAKVIFDAGINYVEVGHGIGIGANLKNSSSYCSDEEYIEAASSVKNKFSKVGAFCFSSNISYDQLNSVKFSGLDFIRFGVDPRKYSADIKYLEYCKKIGLEVFVNFIKSYSYDKKYLSQATKNLYSIGIDGVYIVDSAGGMLPDEVNILVKEIKKIVNNKFFIGFHGHNNLGLANANCLSAIAAGANIIDSSLMGMGRSAGNAITEMLIAILEREKILKEKINIQMVFDLITNVIYPIYPKKNFDKNEILIGKSYFHSSNYPALVTFCKKINVSPNSVLNNFSFKKNVNLNEQLKKKALKLKNVFNKNQVKKNLNEKNIEYLNYSSPIKIKELKKIIASEKFKKNCNVAISVCRSKNNLLEIKDLYSLENIIVGHIESPNAKCDKIIISTFANYFIFFDKNIKIDKNWRNNLIFRYDEKKIFYETIEDFVMFSNYHKIISNSKVIKFDKIKSEKNGKILFVLDNYSKNIEKKLKKIKSKFDILISQKLEKEINYYKKKFPLINNFFKPNYGVYLCSEIIKKISLFEHIKNNVGQYKIEKNNFLVSGGQIGSKGSIVVNSIKFPNKIIGVSDGKGSLVKKEIDSGLKAKVNKWFYSRIIN